MISREEIRSIPIVDRSIKRKQEQLTYLREKATSVPSGLTEGERVQSSVTNTAGYYIDAASDLARIIRAEQLELSDLQHRAEAFISTLESPLAIRILRYRYIDCLKWEMIADLLGYSEDYLRQIERESVNNLLSPPLTQEV